MEAVSDLLQPILALQSNILPWHWFIVAVALGALEMLFTGGILMGGAIAAMLVGAASFAAQKFPDALPPNLGFGLGTQVVTFLVLMGVFASAMRIGRRKAAAMVARAAAPPLPPAPEAVAAPAPSAAPSVAPPTPTSGVIAPVLPPAPKPLMPTPAAAPPAAPAPVPAPARPATPAPEKMSPQPPAQPMVAPPPPSPANPSPRPTTPAKSPPRPTQMGPMRVSGPTAVATPPAATKTPPPPPNAPPPAAPATAAKPGSNPQELVGREYTLWKPLAAGKGTLRIGVVDWALSGPDVAAGARVRVTAVQGSTLTVTLVP